MFYLSSQKTYTLEKCILCVEYILFLISITCLLCVFYLVQKMQQIWPIIQIIQNINIYLTCRKDIIVTHLIAMFIPSKRTVKLDLRKPMGTTT